MSFSGLKMSLPSIPESLLLLIPSHQFVAVLLLSSECRLFDSGNISHRRQCSPRPMCYLLGKQELKQLSKFWCMEFCFLDERLEVF
ncbi:hypothetical protein O6P43_026854 [Quillaja saponaria]|uniref:Uncharacterized protein n=1 Tax=Quillaja saponaria TaxID=32244 RepID=A0AAD7PD45_QUISA|nr:hypothetical protein O6P43_026854 [Quillaja saponaria]